MIIALIIGGVIAFYLIVSTTILRLSTRLVAGIVPTFSSATGAILTSLLFSAILTMVATVLAAERGGVGWLLAGVYLFLQAMVYCMMIKDKEGAEVSFGQASIIIICQIPVAIGVAFLVFFVFAAGGLTLASLMPRTTPAWALSRPAPPPAPAIASPRWGTLGASVIVPTRYGKVTYRGGTPVEIVRELSAGYVVRVNGTEFTTTREQVVSSR